MKLKIFTLLTAVVFSFVCTPPTSAKTLIHPPIPEEDPTTEKVAIVTLPEKTNVHQIKELITPYPDLELRHIFTEALNGFSVKGTKGSLDKLAQTSKVESVSPVTTYSVQSETNTEIIGAESIRGYFDPKNQRLTGKGITVGVIDTGIDYNHPDLRRSYKRGYDLVDIDDDPMETKGMYGQSTLHGTHVAGIIAANGKIQGVAPDAKIIAYRALGPGGSGTTEQVLAAIEKAIKDKVDVLNLSLGNNVNGPDLPISLALNKAVENGIVAVTSSGNSGPNMWTVGSPGTAAKAISVGASTPLLKVPYLTIDGTKETLRLEPMQGSMDWKLDRSYEVVYGKLGKKEDLADVSGKIALIQRGELTFSEKAWYAQEAGAVAVIIFNNMNGEFAGNLDRPIDIPVATMSRELGLNIVKSMASQKVLAKTNIIEEKDLLASFSSRGPVTSTWEIKPDVVAPGVAITSTIPGGYLALQGTSMAAPHVAGAAALIKQAHPDWGPEDIKAALMNTAIPIVDGKDVPYKTYEQGAGRIRIPEAIQTGTLVKPASLQFGKFKLVERQHEHTQQLTFKNVSNHRMSYRFEVPHQRDGIQFELPQSFSVDAGKEKTVNVTMSVDPKELTKKIHEGHLTIMAGSQKVSVPYLYVLEEPNYPRIMGFEFGPGDKQGVYHYEVYLPGGADEFGIALFDPDTYRFVKFLDWKRNVGRGMLKMDILPDQLPENGLYLAKVFAKKAGKEDMVETGIAVSKVKER
ncbi:S8 family serine peptidase [Robertmurraya sp. GLU-23]